MVPWLNVDCWSYHTAAASLLLQLRAFALLKTSKSPPRIIAPVSMNKTIWDRSRESNLQYNFMVCDGDSKAYGKESHAIVQRLSVREL